MNKNLCNCIPNDPKVKFLYNLIFDFKYLIFFNRILTTLVNYVIFTNVVNNAILKNVIDVYK